jgi:alanyl-tRNA synthetase
MRRLVRRALRFGLDLGLTGGICTELVPIVAATYAEVYPEVGEQAAEIVAVLQKEERSFSRTLAKGLRRLRNIATSAPAVTGADLFELHDTFGMPVELSVEEARRQDYRLDAQWQPEYAELVEAQRARSRAVRTPRS